VAPKIESKSAPSKPAKEMIPNPLQLPPVGVSMEARMAMKIAPPAAEIVPRNEIAPDVPRSTGFQEVITRGRDGLSTPSSVAHVSALTAASEAANANQKEGLAGSKIRLPACS